MPLSTSNSDAVNTEKNLNKTWVFAIILVIIVFAAWESFWRMKGFTPAIEDDRRLWHLIRSKITEQTKTVFIGASRIQLGVHPDVYADLTGDKPLILAIDGNPPFSVLQNLADDPSFKGNLFCSVHPRWLAEKPPKKDRAAKWIRKYKPPSLLLRLELSLSLLIQKNFAFRYPGLSLPKLKKKWEQGKWPQPAYSSIRTDRYREANFSPVNTPKILASRIKKVQDFTNKSDPLTGEKFNQRIKIIDVNVNKIQARGGNVIFIRMPSSGRVRELESKTWPRNTYWDIFAANVSGIRIHFEDHASLKDFKCPDGSHLDIKDAKIFTRNLIQILKLEK